MEKAILEREASWVYSMVTTDGPRMDKLIGESLRYIHVTGGVSTKEMFMKEHSTGFTETDFRDTTMRQFGATVIVLHIAKYRHTGKPQQSSGEAMHAWVMQDGQWVMIGRHSTRFANY